jgi:hypothetical protein
MGAGIDLRKSRQLKQYSIEALRAAAASPWVEVDLVRLNPVGAYMDADPGTVISRRIRPSASL